MELELEELKESIKEKLLEKFAIGEVEIKVHSNVHLYGGTQCADISVYNLIKKENKISGTYFYTKTGTSSYGNSNKMEFSANLAELLKELINEEMLYEEFSSFDGDDEFWADNHKMPDEVYINGERLSW